MFLSQVQTVLGALWGKPRRHSSPRNQISLRGASFDGSLRGRIRWVFWRSTAALTLWLLLLDDGRFVARKTIADANILGSC